MLTIVAHELPSTQGSKKSFVDRGGHQRTIEDNRSALVIWRGAVAEAVVKARDAFGSTCPDPQCGDSTWDHECQLGGNPYRNPLEGPVVVAVTFTMPKPVSAPKRKPSWPMRKRDVDKLERAVFDALKIGGALGDDGQVVEVVRQAKWFPVRDAAPVYLGTDAAYMMTLAGTARDVMDHPGAVIRVAHYTELPSIRDYLAAAGFEPKDMTGGS
jgi:crossover junction endodeoxyribonuclease RusA